MEKIRRFKVKENEKEMEVIIAGAEDKSEADYLEEAEREKTSEQLRKSPPKEESKFSKEEIGGALNEYRKWQREVEQRTNPKKKYF